MIDPNLCVSSLRRACLDWRFGQFFKQFDCLSPRLLGALARASSVGL